MILSLLMLLAPAGPPPGATPKPPRICREGEKQLGTHMHASRRCLTAEQWQVEDARRDRIPITARVTADPDDAARAATRPH
jgi:hypothetical protein